MLLLRALSAAPDTRAVARGRRGAVEREHILQVIARTPTLEDAARILGIDSSTLWRKRKRYDEPH